MALQRRVDGVALPLKAEYLSLTCVRDKDEDGPRSRYPKHPVCVMAVWSKLIGNSLGFKCPCTASCCWQRWALQGSLAGQLPSVGARGTLDALPL